jgi:tRNA-2-methylthio-N6-dimethylallyladenosine synthase
MSQPLVQIRRPAAAGPAGRADAPRLYVETYGCQMNLADSDLIASLCRGRGYQPAAAPGDADVILLNTCAVREQAEERVFGRAAELHALTRARPQVVLGIVGCMAEHLKNALLERAPYIDVIAGPDAYRRLPDLIEQARQAPAEHDPFVDVRLDRLETYEGLDAAGGGDGVSGFVTIQRGCDKFCTFCVVPLTRGRERGTPPREVLRQVRALVAAGYREVTLLGQTVNSYRHEDLGFAELLRAVARVPGLQRVRFTSPYPVDFTADVVAAIAEEPRVCKHVHLPLQSGSDAVLARMRRGYGYADFMAIVRALRSASPGIALTTDLIVGFSGETAADHARTLAAMAEIRFDGAYMFAYSERAGTQAERKLPDDVAQEEKKRRLAEVIALQNRHSAESNQQLVGQTVRVLVHGRSKKRASELLARTDGYKACIVPAAGLCPGQLVDVRIARASSATLYGAPV